MKTVKINCSRCQNFFEKREAEYNRQRKKGNNNFYCSKQCSIKGVALTQTINTEIIKECLYCKNNFTSSTHKKSKKCCGKECAAKYSQMHSDKNKISESMKKYYTNNPPIKRKLNCKICNVLFVETKNRKQTCSTYCLRKLISQNSTKNINCGGETNYKKFKYKNIWMDSSWEVELAKWLDAKNIKWKRDRKIIFYWTDAENKKRRYYPDFYLPQYNIYLDPKNKFKLEKDSYKLNQVIKENNIRLVYGLVSDVIQSLQIMLNEKK